MVTASKTRRDRQIKLTKSIHFQNVSAILEQRMVSFPMLDFISIYL